ncbi:ergothioneine biosynthesis protein EgtC [Piscicoccus intestinalis]|uniref:ergothioneine biosynthesis protein EgtC n=1 Tax=Piscicoccus intestinalis TaxID=746033 RepID=UPI0008380F8E|nr:ergothioneine biosynthesis protein EgtC [Piscicoccus intestinalis]
MCRHLAWLGPPRTLERLLCEPEFGLLRQSYAPRRQRFGTINTDGFGAAWYVAGRPEPVRYRRAQPMWADASFASLAPTIAAGCALGAVRSATIGTAADESCAAPFADGPLAFSHNGRIDDWAGARRALAADVAEVPQAWAGVDSALAFGLAAAAYRREALDHPPGEAPGAVAAALVEAVARLRPFGGRLTFLATDGATLAGTVVAEPMYVTRRDGGVLVASEPDGTQQCDDEWRQIPDEHLVRVAGAPPGVDAPDGLDVVIEPLPN